MCELMDANVKCVENKSIVVQQEDKCVAQVLLILVYGCPES
jgi:hypothetical protein